MKAGGDQQAVVRGLHHATLAVVGRHHALDAVHVRHRLAQVQGDAVFGVPAQRVEDDLVDGLLTGQHRAEQDAVVVGVRFGPEHGDVVEVGCDFQQLFERAHTGHAVADHHKLHLLHGGVSLGQVPGGQGASRAGRTVWATTRARPAGCSGAARKRTGRGGRGLRGGRGGRVEAGACRPEGRVGLWAAGLAVGGHTSAVHRHTVGVKLARGVPGFALGPALMLMAC